MVFAQLYNVDMLTIYMNFGRKREFTRETNTNASKIRTAAGEAGTKTRVSVSSFLA